MTLLDLITHIIIKDTNGKECVVARAKALSTKTNVVKDKCRNNWLQKGGVEWSLNSIRYK